MRKVPPGMKSMPGGGSRVTFARASWVASRAVIAVSDARNRRRSLRLLGGSLHRTLSRTIGVSPENGAGIPRMRSRRALCLGAELFKSNFTMFYRGARVRRTDRVDRRIFRVFAGDLSGFSMIRIFGASINLVA